MHATEKEACQAQTIAEQQDVSELEPLANGGKKTPNSKEDQIGDNIKAKTYFTTTSFTLHR